MNQELIEQAEISYKNGNYGKASIILKSLLSTIPNNKDLTIRTVVELDLACSFCMEGKYSEALELLEPILMHCDEEDFDEETEKKLYCASALCFIQTNKLVKAFYALSLYLRLVRRICPDEFFELSHILSAI